MNKFTVSKGRGRAGRVIHAPGPLLKAKLRELIKLITSVERRAAKQARVWEVAHCIKGRSAVTCAAAHVGFDWSLCVDLADCFGSVGDGFRKRWPLCYIVGVAGLPQGFPTSPALANLALVPLDRAIKRLLASQCKYTRYVDDLTISGSRSVNPMEVLAGVRACVARMGLRLARHKTRLQWASFGNRVITGVGVGSEGLYARRSVRRRIRAARHRRRWRVVRGLVEWSKLRMPAAAAAAVTGGGRWPQCCIEAKALCADWRLRIGRGVWDEIIARQETDTVIGNIIVTTDPCLMLGPNEWSGFNTCYSHPSGRYHHTVVFMARCSGVYLAYEPSGGWRNCFGVRRPGIRGRCWLYRTCSGDWYRSRAIYGSAGVLRAALTKLDVGACAGVGARIAGSGVGASGGWFDDLERSGKWVLLK